MNIRISRGFGKGKTQMKNITIPVVPTKVQNPITNGLKYLSVTDNPTVTPPPAQPNKPTTCNQPVTNPLRHAKKQIREREPRDARSAASGEHEPFRASFSAALA